jgi:hypothetical protein
MPLMDEIKAACAAGAIEIESFDYTVEFTLAALLAGATITNPINIQNDSDFVVRQGQYTVWSAATVFVVNPDINISLFDTGSGRNWQDVPLPILNKFGTAQLPFLWPEPKLVKGGSVIQITATNRHAIALQAYLTLSGFKVFSKGEYWRK